MCHSNMATVSRDSNAAPLLDSELVEAEFIDAEEYEEESSLFDPPPSYEEATGISSASVGPYRQESVSVRPGMSSTPNQSGWTSQNSFGVNHDPVSNYPPSGLYYAHSHHVPNSSHSANASAEHIDQSVSPGQRILLIPAPVQPEASGLSPVCQQTTSHQEPIKTPPRIQLPRWMLTRAARRRALVVNGVSRLCEVLFTGS